MTGILFSAFRPLVNSEAGQLDKDSSTVGKSHDSVGLIHLPFKVDMLHAAKSMISNLAEQKSAQVMVPLGD